MTIRHASRVSLALVLTACLTGATTPQEEAEPRPNIVLLMADDMGWGDWSWGQSAGVARPGDPVHSALETPNLDRLAASGVTFERFYAAAPVCSPTRGSCLTGRHPLRYGIRGANSGHLLESEHTLAELLDEAGYATGFFGKWHLGTFTTTGRDSNRGGREGQVEHFNPPGRHGFDEWFATEAKVPTYNPMIHPETREPYGTAYWRTDGERETENLEGDDSRVIMDRALPFVRAAAEGQQPFLSVIWFHTPHLPVVASREDVALYEQVEAQVPGQDLNELRQYFGCLTALDREVGRLLETLDELGQRENTVIWFASDNGPEGKAKAPGSNGGLRGRKRALYEGGVRVPGIVSWPARLPAARRASTPGVTSDILPTLVDWLELTPPEALLDGVSLVEHLEDDTPRGRTPIGFMTARSAAWVDGRWKLVGKLESTWDDSEVSQWELYDLLEDPAESHDLAADQPERCEAMAAAWRAWRSTF